MNRSIILGTVLLFLQTVAYGQEPYADFFEDIESTVPDTRLRCLIYQDPFGDIPSDGDYIYERDIRSECEPVRQAPRIAKPPLDEPPPPAFEIPQPAPSIEQPFILAPQPVEQPVKTTKVEEEISPIPLGFYLAFRGGIPNMGGIELGGDVHSNVRVRAATQFFFFTLKVTGKTIKTRPYNASLFLLWPEVFIDLYPSASSSFRFSLGAAYVGHRFELGEKANPFKANASDDSFALTFKNPVAPSLGMGWDFGRAKDSGWIGSFEFGASWVGKPVLKRTTKNPENTFFSDDTSKFKKPLDDLGKFLQVLPWMNFTVGYKF